ELALADEAVAGLQLDALLLLDALALLAVAVAQAADDAPLSRLGEHLDGLRHRRAEDVADLVAALRPHDDVGAARGGGALGVELPEEAHRAVADDPAGHRSPSGGGTLNGTIVIARGSEGRGRVAGLRNPFRAESVQCTPVGGFSPPSGSLVHRGASCPMR